MDTGLVTIRISHTHCFGDTLILQLVVSYRVFLFFSFQLNRGSRQRSVLFLHHHTSQRIGTANFNSNSEQLSCVSTLTFSLK